VDTTANTAIGYIVNAMHEQAELIKLQNKVIEQLAPEGFMETYNIDVWQPASERIEDNLKKADTTVTMYNLLKGVKNE
jgi:hypothetical protein